MEEKKLGIIAVTWDTGERVAFYGPEPPKALEYRFIPVRRIDNDHAEWLVKDKIRSIEDFPAEDWNKMVEEQKKKAEEQADAQAAAQAKKKSEDDAKTAALAARPWWKKLFGPAKAPVVPFKG